MAGALDGIRVIDFGQWLAGPSPLYSWLTREQRSSTWTHLAALPGRPWPTHSAAWQAAYRPGPEEHCRSGVRARLDQLRRCRDRELPPRGHGPLGTRLGCRQAVTTASSTARCPASPPMTRGPQCRRGKACWLPRPARTPGAARRISPASTPCLSPLSGALAAAIAIVMALIARERTASVNA